MRDAYLRSSSSSDAVGDAPVVSVVFPCLNEERTIAACVRKSFRTCENLGASAEVIVADNGSLDRSRELACEAGALVVGCPVRGYGAAVQAGAAAASGQIIVMADADDSYDLASVGDFIFPLLRDEADFVIGNRFAGGIEEGAMPWKNRWIGNPALSLLLRLLFGGQVAGRSLRPSRIHEARV